MATCLGLGSPGRRVEYSVKQEIIRLVDNEFLKFWSWVILHFF